MALVPVSLAWQPAHSVGLGIMGSSKAVERVTTNRNGTNQYSLYNLRNDQRSAETNIWSNSMNTLNAKYLAPKLLTHYKLPFCIQH